MEITAQTAILGAGITGLCTAHQLDQQNQSFHLLETSPQVGGALQTSLQNGYLAEHGPNSLLVKDKRVEQLLQDLNLSSTESNGVQSANEAAKKRYIVHNGQPHAMPASPWGMMKTPLFSAKGKLRFALEPLIGRYSGLDKGQGEESFADFVRRRLGPDMLASAAGPFVSGIYAGNPENLSVRHAFPRLWNLEHHYRSFILGAIALQFGLGPIGKNPHRLSPARMISFESGMSSLPRSIAANLPQESVKLSCQITGISPVGSNWQVQWLDEAGASHTGIYRNLVVSIPHHQLPKLPLPEEIIADLAPVIALASPPVTSLVLGFKRSDISHPLDGFGMLIKQSEKSPLLGVLFSSSMFEGRAPEGYVTLTCMMGGSIHPEFAENDDDVVLQELDRLLGVKGSPTFRHRSPWKHAIPQYDLQYQHAVDALEDCEKQHPGLHFVGNYRGGISVGDCIVNGLELGRSLA